MSGDRVSQEASDASLEREAIAWLVRVTDDEATTEDRVALKRWQKENPAHERAFAKASGLWHTMPAAIDTALRSGDISLLSTPDQVSSFVTRRRFMAGFATATVSAAAAAAAYAMLKPPFELWPSLSELAADYRTAVGQQRRIDIAKAVSVEMNTRTSIALRPTTDQQHRFELIAGEAVVKAAVGSERPIEVIAADGMTIAEEAGFDIRCEAALTSVTCLSGMVRVQHRRQSVTLTENQQVRYGGGELSSVAEVDPSVITAWQNGYLMFRGEPLAQVLAEVNRYRPGRIVLLDEKLGEGLVTARFKLDRLDDVIVQIREVFGASIRSLPGGIVLVG